MIHIKKMMCVCTVIFAVISRISPVYGAFEYIGLGWPAATANIKTVGQHPHQFVVNPALMEENQATRIVLSYQKPFQSLDLQAGSLTLQNSFKQTPYIHHLEYFGDEHYSELKLINGSVWSVANGYRVGVTLNYHHLSVAGIKSQNALSLSLSSHAEISGQLKVGSVMEHAIRWGRALSLPQKFHVGGEYVVGPVTLLIGLEKESVLPLETCLGLQVSSRSLWQIGLGYRALSGMMSAGWRIHTRKITLNYVFVLHPHLPVSHGFGLEMVLP
ncbi:MAG: hypothetical protein HQ506_12935 [Candidatus Marinimicrobia bacterium]|nr:hypothetical protein [Candidatus Neomarinimicrobiota bacterium]